MRLTSWIPVLIASLLLASAGKAAAWSPQTGTVAHWKFHFAESDCPAELQPFGAVQFQQAGPRAPEFPTFSTDQQAVRLDGKGAAFLVKGAGAKPEYQFANGDCITIESWVKLEDLKEGQQVYILSKGRTGAHKQNGMANQNWSLRLNGLQKIARLDFLFTTRVGNEAPTWHRWRSAGGFVPKTGWHHIAISYEYGQPDSMRGWIDGIPTDGTWDLAGPTSDPPVVDDDDVWIGTSMKRSANSSLQGSLAEVSLSRIRPSDAEMATKFQRTGGPQVLIPQPSVMPELGKLPAGYVQYSLAEDFPRHTGWLYQGENLPPKTLEWQGEEFLLPRIPLRYEEWGIRSSWKGPVLLRMAADVELPAGSQRFLLRARGLSRLWVDGQLAAETRADTVRYDGGRNPIDPPPQPPLPGMRPVGGNMQEVVGEIQLSAADMLESRRYRVVLEVIVGGAGIRTDSGEVCVARLSEEGDTYELLRPAGQPQITLSEAEMQPTLTRIEQQLTDLDARTRRTAARSQAEYWEKRHTWAREWSRDHLRPEIPEVAGPADTHPVDAFLLAKMNRVREQQAASQETSAGNFHQQVLPILQKHCFRCHSDKQQGGLRLDQLKPALAGGDSGLPAIVPGRPEESELLARIQTEDESLKMPPTGAGLTAEEQKRLENWIQSGADWPAENVDESQLTLAEVVGDAAYLRRLSLDVIGLPPTAEELERFLQDSSPRKREEWLERLLADERKADHWISFWMDLLAENPSLISATLNSTGPFRWFLYESLRDEKPLDRMVTELVMMRGSVHEGGSAGFSVAGENDSPLAAKGHILASALLGIELQCARCHDSPYHSTTQQDLYSLAAMLNRKPVKVPATSRVPDEFFENQVRASLIQVSLNPNQPVSPSWPFAEETGVKEGASLDRLLQKPDDSRERLAALITSPENHRFPQVIVNHVWKRLMGTGFVEPVNDWEGKTPSHPELLNWLAAEFVSHHYDFNHLLKLIITSDAYQREAVGNNALVEASERFFNAPDRRRLTAEQVVDALHAVTETPFEVETLSFDPLGQTTMGYRLNLGRLKRAWMMADLKNERDRPSLSLPRARMIADVLEVFGWTGARQKPIPERDKEPNVLQPGILSNSVLTAHVVRAAHNSALADLAVQADSPAQLLNALFLRILNRPSTPVEQEVLLSVLAPGFETRLIPGEQVEIPQPAPRLPLITWFNHAQSEANTIQMENEQRVRAGLPPDPRLQPEWRERFEDVVWTLINHREFVWIP